MKEIVTALPFNYPLKQEREEMAQKTLSFYLPSYDGTKIALDVTLPECAKEEKVPAIVMVTRFDRRNLQDFETAMGKEFVKAGYAHIIVELRGCGVSFGINRSFCDEDHCRDLLATVDWVEKQDWCSGKIGIYGGSNRSFIQLCAGALTPKNITAINPVVAVADFYYQNYPNGVSACPNISFPKPSVMPSKTEFLKTATPVDEDIAGDMAYEAFSKDQWPNNLNFFETLFMPSMNRDSEHPLYNFDKTNITIPPYGKLDAFYKTGVKQHQFIGELESGTLGQLALFLDYGGSVCLGPWTHGGAISGKSPFEDGDYSVVEAYLNWYDYALKNEDNGFNQVPPVSYYVINAPKGKHWRVSECWPPKNEARTTLYLSNEKSGTSSSCNDGVLTRELPEEGTVDYQVRTDIVVFPDEKGQSTYNRSELYWNGDMESSVDSKGLTFTSAPLFKIYQNEFAGCISVNLWISCTQPDVDLVVYAEEVCADGTSHYIKDGVMRASHRTVGDNPSWEKMGAYWHPSMSEDVEACLKEGLSQPTLLQFAIDPTCYHFQQDSRIRFTITCANTSAYQHTMYTDALPILTLYTGGKYASNISVPFLDQTYQTYKGKCEDNDAVLYRFEDNSYVYTNECWHRYSNNDMHRVEGSNLILPDGKVFSQIGAPENAPYAHRVIENIDDIHPVARFARELVAQVPVSTRDYTLFVPESKYIYMDIYNKNSVNKAPCIIYAHGYGCPYSYLPSQLRTLYEEGFAIACLDLRNYPPNEFPDYIHDAKGCVRYVRAHAERFGIDPDRIGIYGASLGGNTALMLALTGDDATLEGNVGGNEEYSSKIQAAACGYAWCDLLHMGSDISKEPASSKEMVARRVEMTEGEFSPSSELIGFAGKGKGLKVLRDYAESREFDPVLQQKLEQAYYASPIHHISSDVPPIALFGGYGEDGCNIAFKQSLRTFDALQEVGALVYLFGNTCGKYGETPEVQAAISEFFRRHLKDKK